jgi:hypothetical protein
VPSRYGRLFGSITTLTSWLSNTWSSGLIGVGELELVRRVPEAAGRAHAEPQADALAALGE